MTPINKLLPLLSKVVNRGNGRWIACCPAHEDKSPSLAIKELDDGMIILHCFAGCEKTDILESIGLTFNDLYVDNPEYHKRVHNPIPVNDVLACIHREIGIIDVAAWDIINGRKISVSDYARITLAHSRISKALEIIKII